MEHMHISEQAKCDCAKAKKQVEELVNKLRTEYSENHPGLTLGIGVRIVIDENGLSNKFSVYPHTVNT